MYNIGVIGDYDSICGFSALGLETFPVESVDHARSVLKSLINQKYGIIYITEHYMQQLEHECERCRDEAVPAIVPVPSSTGVLGYGKSILKISVERAVGSDIIFNDND